MIIHLKNTVAEEEAQRIAEELQAILITKEEFVLVTPSKLQELPAHLTSKVSKAVAVPNDIQLASKLYLSKHAP